MKKAEREKAIELRKRGWSINEISSLLQVSKSSVSIWVRNIELLPLQVETLRAKPHSFQAVEKRRVARLKNEAIKRNRIIEAAKNTISPIDDATLKLLGVMLYWAEGGKTQRLVRFSNGATQK